MPIVFASRIDAAQHGFFATALVNFRGRNPLVLAIPRGAVEMGRVLADELEEPRSSTSCSCASSAPPRAPSPRSGRSTRRAGRTWPTTPARPARTRRTSRARGKTTGAAPAGAGRSTRPPDPRWTPARRVVIVVDDGLATGATMIAALHAARDKQPERLVCAVPVAAPDSLERVRPYVDEIVCLQAPAEFFAVGRISTASSGR